MRVRVLSGAILLWLLLTGYQVLGDDNSDDDYAASTEQSLGSTLQGPVPLTLDFLWCRVALQDDYVLFHYANISVPVGRFQNRVHLVGDILHHDGSLLLQNVEEADQGNYTCEIRFQMESLVFKKAVVLHVLPEEPKGT